jgi:hypothetical protein
MQYPILAGLLWCVSFVGMQSIEPIRQERPSPAVLSFPEIGLDDTTAYKGYQTRFFRDASDNTLQIYLDGHSGRVVHLLADADDESVGLTVRDAGGNPVRVNWGPSVPMVSAVGRGRVFEYALIAGAQRIDLGLFLLGSMRVERDFQYGDRHRQPFAATRFIPPEMDRLFAALDRLDPAERRRHLAALNASSVSELRSRLQPSITTQQNATTWTARVVQPSLDARDTLSLEVLADLRRATPSRNGDVVSLSAIGGTTTPFTLRISTTGKPLTPLTRQEIFTPEFLSFLATSRRTDSMSMRARWLEREVRGVELLSSREKLMAGLPAYATYFGRDMLVSALMMRPIWRADMSAFAIASALRKLGPNGDVSHEEALGGQADREAANEYANLVDASLRARETGDTRTADSLVARAFVVIREHRRVRENYHMIDNDFQLAVLEGRWLGDARVSRDRKRAFLLDSTDGEPRVRRMLRELALVSRMTAAYVANPLATNLVSFPQRDSTHWQSASWRDSNAGYGGGRFAMDVNAVWAPHALEAIGVVFRALRDAGIAPDSTLRAMHDDAANAVLLRYAGDAASLSHAVTVWRGAERHFVVRLPPAELQSRIAARVQAMPDADRRYWSGVVAARPVRDTLSFLALSLDAAGAQIAVVNSDPSTRLFLLDDPSDSAHASVLRDVRLFVQSYPVGLFIDRVGPVVANDAAASPAIWQQFQRDPYHGPRVVWGREVNLFLLGVMNQLAMTRDAAYANELRAAVDRLRSAVDASGFHSELWSYEVRNGHVEPARYGTGSDVQLWSTTDLAVEYALSRLRR